MPNLLEEARGGASEKVAGRVRDLGGNLFDEASFKSGDTSRLSSRFTQQQADEERKRLLDELNASLGTFERFTVGAGRGLTTLGRGVGLAAPEDPATGQAFGALAEESIAAQAGEIIGEAAPFLAAAPLTGAGLVGAGGRQVIQQATRLAPRILGASVLGAAEGGIITSGRGGGAGETATGAATGGVVAGALETIFPIIGRLGRQIFDRLRRTPRGPLLTPEGAPTPELQQALEETGTSFEDLTSQAFAEVNQQGVDPAQAVRAARLEQQAIPATAGDISQDFGQQTAEQRLISQASSEAGEPLRQLKLEQSEAFKARVTELVDSLGVPQETGDTLKAALSGRKKVLKAEKNALYKQVAESAPEIANLPLLTDEILSAVPGKQELRRLSRLAGNQVDAVQDLLVEFGIEKGDDALGAFVETGGEVTPLSLGNFEDFRQALNQIERADTTGAASVVTGPLKTALDAEADIIDKHVKASGIADESILDTLRQARDRVRTVKTEFSPLAITGRLIDVKRDGVTPVIEASKVTQELLRPNAPIENLERTLSSLRKAGDKGQKAIGDMQASVVLNALNDALKAPSRKTSGIETIGGNQFAKALSQFGDDKLKELFKGNTPALNRLLNLKQTALDITPTSGAVPKGSASVILDVLQRAGSLPGLAAIRDTVRFVVGAGADDRAVRRAINAKPALKRAASALEQDFPALASALGIAGITPLQEREQ